MAQAREAGLPWAPWAPGVVGVVLSSHAAATIKRASIAARHTRTSGILLLCLRLAIATSVTQHHATPATAGSQTATPRARSDARARGRRQACEVSAVGEARAQPHCGPLHQEPARARAGSQSQEAPLTSIWSLSSELISVHHFVALEAIITFDVAAAWAETCSAAFISARVCGMCKILPSPSCTSRRKY